MKHYDFIMAGGGLAGLSLALNLVCSPLGDRSILIVDRDDKNRNDHTWCFWSEGASPFDEVVHLSELVLCGRQHSSRHRPADGAHFGPPDHRTYFKRDGSASSCARCEARIGAPAAGDSPG